MGVEEGRILLILPLCSDWEMKVCWCPETYVSGSSRALVKWKLSNYLQ